MSVTDTEPDLDVPFQVNSKIIWEDILNEKNEKINLVNEYFNSKIDVQDITPENSYLQYLNENIFPILLPILEKTIFKAIRMECLVHQKSLFNSIDYISERLWVTNAKYPERLNGKQYIFHLDWVQKYLKKHPRLIFPKSWIWTREEAALVIQSYMRGYFVRKEPYVQDMRQFWKILAREKAEKEDVKIQLTKVKET